MQLPRFTQPGPVAWSPWRPTTWALVVNAALLAGLLLGIAVTVFVPQGRLSDYRYHVWRWEADTLVDNFFARIGVGPDPSATEGEAAVRNYFRLTSQMRAALSRDPIDQGLVDTLSNERASYENDVERLIERYIGEAIERSGLQRPLPLFNGVRQTWPPVDFELTNPPQLLVRSPRDHIERAGDTLLRNDLSIGDIQQIEADTDDEDTVSLVVSIGGLAAYPAIVREDRSYDSLLDTASHEWVHHYLAFYPLGEQWGKSGEAESLNETTANIAGREIANLIRKAHPLKLPPGEDGSAPAGQPPTVDFNVEMRKLRLEVDALLKDGKVAEAERTMEERRQYLEAHGITIRKLNQAYFAFYGTYADTPASSSPIGPKIEKLWQLTGNVGTFLKVMRDVRSVADLDAALGRIGSGH